MHAYKHFGLFYRRASAFIGGPKDLARALSRVLPGEGAANKKFANVFIGFDLRVCDRFRV
jgi:hypothetical protein